VFNQTDFLNNNIGIKNAAIFYFDKKIENLNEEEIITLIVMMENPSLYNPKRRKEMVEDKVKLYLKLYYK
jgi:membrane peptidoglycan carboxypeptidase